MRAILLGALALGIFLIPSQETNGAPNSSAKTMIASWYKHGKRTANGEKFDPEGFTAAHKTLPFGTVLRLTHESKVLIVRINDRGPYIQGRHLDLTVGAARKLGCIDNGVCRVGYEIMRLGSS
ncbi:MAG: septal ring lytic transglycosylase RlpA family protein [Alphaproteobacteria bacterium]|nr:septal ring lytic transglycosylase RlpA family protein [Alphaproteobacteria bacterium]